MKRILLTFCTGILFTLFASADNTGLFTYNPDQIEQELGQLQLLEDYVYANPGTTLTGLQASECTLISNLDLNNNFLGGFDKKDDDDDDDDDDNGPPLGISSFLWGCCLGLPGILVVYLVSEDSDETKKALTGCIVSSLSGCAIYVIVYVLIVAGYLSVFSSYYYW